MFKSLGGKALVVALVVGTGSVAAANTWPNSIKLNGVKLNGVKLNGVKLNGTQGQGQAGAEAPAARVTSITLADGTVLRAR
jgi:hypothetical protein